MAGGANHFGLFPWRLLLAVAVLLPSTSPALRAADPSAAAPPADARAAVVPAANPGGPAPAGAAAPGPAPSEFAKTPIRRASPTDGQGAAGTTTPAHPATGPDLVRVGLALAVVIGLIFFLRWGSRRLFNTPASARPTQAVQVLARSVLSPKQQVVLLQVGRRVLVVADGGAQVSALGQITDPDEVAALVGQISAERQSSPSANFGSLLGRVTSKFRGTTAETDADDAPEERVVAGSSTGRRYETLEDVFDYAEAERGEPGDQPASRTSNAEESNVVAATQEELSGLMEKVRLVSKQFGRG